MNFRNAPFDRRTPYSQEELFLMFVPRAGAILYKREFAMKGQRGEERSMKRIGMRGPEPRSVPFVPIVEAAEVVLPVRPRRCPPAPKKAKSKSQPQLQSLPARRRAPVAAARKTLFEAPQAGFVVDGVNPFLLVSVVPEVVIAQSESFATCSGPPEIVISLPEVSEIEVALHVPQTVNPSLLSPFPRAAEPIIETVIPAPTPIVKANTSACPRAPRRKQIKPVQQQLKRNDRKRLFTDS